jgi:hypothetical protein
MKHEKMQLVIPRRTRAHKVLFDNDSPFRSRTVEYKNQYKRKPKHRAKGFDNDF